MQFIVWQKPKHKYKHVYSTCVMIVEAASAAEAKRKAVAEQPEAFNSHADFITTKVEPLTVGAVYSF